MARKRGSRGGGGVGVGARDHHAERRLLLDYGMQPLAQGEGGRERPLRRARRKKKEYEARMDAIARHERRGAPG